ncbi:hypothetical protein EDC94DRAFT_598181 [Helicostylum pulchrum]|nr:hypothetical protein EDC94DRAFT_598181 [Helicostylum pulchrum]
MDKPSQTKLYAGLVIYRIQRNVEYLLLNDSFTNKKHWFCPKGQIIGNEEEIKCALRETFEATGLRPTDLRIEEGFVIEFKYLSDTKPKKVKYYLAQLLDNHVRLLPNAEGVHMQWFTQPAASEKVIFKSMQEVFKHAQQSIDTKPHRRLKNVEDIKPTSTLKRQPVQVPSSSPLYKTRLCERFETEGTCPYGAKCNFAHGITELRGRDQEDRGVLSVPIPTVVCTNQMMDAGNQLFKTKLCEKFIKEKFCQYGPKCHFAHGENELKERPKKEEAEVAVTLIHSNGHGNGHINSNGNNMNNNNRKSFNEANGRDSSWRSNVPERRRSPSSEDEVVPTNHVGRSIKESSWRSNVSAVPKTPPPVSVPDVVVVKPTIAVEELRRPAFVEHQNRPASVKKEKKTMVAPVTTEKSWMKIVKLSKEEQDEMESNNNVQQKTNCSSAKLAQTELIINDLKKFFATHVNTEQVVGTKGKLMEDVKEVTKIEMRNDLSKKQLLYILLVSLLEDSTMLVTILKSRDHLFKTLVKTNADQILLLKAWDTFVTQRKPIMVNKTAAALSHWYDCEMIEEEAFVQWYNSLEKESPLEAKSAKFIEWLNSSDEEEED